MGIENKLRKYQGYRKNSIAKWRKQFEIKDEVIAKILKKLQVIGGQTIRRLIRETIKKNRRLFDSNNCFICKLGGEGESGSVIIYAFKHVCGAKISSKIIDLWKIPSLPEGSKIIFVDDFIGTGTTTTDFFNDEINVFLNPRHEIYSMIVCATQQGIEYVKRNTNLKEIMPALVLTKQEHQYLDRQCAIFTKEEKKYLANFDDKLKSEGDSWSLGLLIAFHYSVPNNTFRFIWKDNFGYRDDHNTRRRLFALLPRKY